MHDRLTGAARALAALLLCPAAWAAEGGSPPALDLPVDCVPGRDCWVANYVDVDTSAVARDFRCRARTYDAHDGVDIAIRDLAALRAGVPVLAAAGGVVRGARDGVEDRALADPASRAQVAGRECGNGVLIEHPGGWQTQYCHLRRGSVRVVPGEAVEARAPIGLVGLSGRTEFPHLHFALRRGAQPVDPFTGALPEEGCGAEPRPLWRPTAAIGYEEFALYNAGFATGAPDIDAIRRGERDDGPFPVAAPALVLWVDMLGVRAGDRLRFDIRGPDGGLVHRHEQSIERTQARRFVYSGARLRAPAWPAGRYRGELLLLRPDEGPAPEGRVVVEAELR